VSNALVGLPLLCKGCGERMVVPPPEESLPEPPPPKPAFDRSLPASNEHDDPPDILITPTVEDSEVNLFLTPEARKKLFLPIEGSGSETPAPPAPEAEPIPVPPAESRVGRKAKWIDAGVFGAVLVLGAVLGEFAARKSTLRIFGDAPASPTFPPTDLLLWVASVAGCGLLYGWLMMRGWSLGPRLSRR
jgi:hypothetical protein